MFAGNPRVLPIPGWIRLSTVLLNNYQIARWASIEDLRPALRRERYIVEKDSGLGRMCDRADVQQAFQRSADDGFDPFGYLSGGVKPAAGGVASR